MKHNKIIALVVLLILTSSLVSYSQQHKDATLGLLNIKEYNAIGNGINDDTDAIQKAINFVCSKKNKLNERLSGIFIPSGIFRITKTLTIPHGRGFKIYGSGYYNGSSLRKAAIASVLAWDGEKGGNLLQIDSNSRLILSGFALTGILDKRNKKNMAKSLMTINTITNSSANWEVKQVTFSDAHIGIDLGAKGKNICNSDMTFNAIDFKNLDYGFIASNSQALDFHFIRCTAYKTGTVFYFKKGGNLNAATCSYTNCDLILKIDSGGINTGNFNLQSIRVERHSSPGKDYQIINTMDSNSGPIMVNITSLECAWPGKANHNNRTPLLAIGPGTFVSVKQSIITGPIAEMRGTKKENSFLIVRESYFFNDYTIKNNENSFFKIKDCVGKKTKAGSFVPLKDKSNWK